MKITKHQFENLISKIVKAEVKKVKKVLAATPYSSVEELYEYLLEGGPEVRQYIARDPRSTPKILTKLSTNRSPETRMMKQRKVTSGSNLLTILEKGSDDAVQVIDNRTNKIIRGDIGYRDTKNKSIDVEFTLKNPSGSLSRKYLTFIFDGDDFKTSNRRYKLKKY